MQYASAAAAARSQDGAGADRRERPAGADRREPPAGDDRGAWPADRGEWPAGADRHERATGTGRTRRRQTRRRRPRGPRWARVLVVAGAVLMVLSGAGIVSAKVALHEATKSIKQTNLFGAAQPTHASIVGAQNILLVGVDARPNQSSKKSVRSDSIIILHISASHDRAYLISIPRDTWVRIPPYDNGKVKFRGGEDRINGAFADGGAGLTGLVGRQHGFDLLSRTLTDLYGLTFNAGAIVDFVGFQEVVQILGGVHMYVDETTTSIHVGHDKNNQPAAPFHINSDGTVGRAIPGVKPDVYTVGPHDFTSWQALDYVRQRDKLANNDFDYGRQRHQQQFIKAVLQKVVSGGTLTNLSKLNKVTNALGKAMTIDTRGASIEDWIFAMRGIGMNSLVTIKTNGGRSNTTWEGKQEVESLNPDSLQLLRSVRDDRVDEFLSQHSDWAATA